MLDAPGVDRRRARRALLRRSLGGPGRGGAAGPGARASSRSAPPAGFAVAQPRARPVRLGRQPYDTHRTAGRCTTSTTGSNGAGGYDGLRSVLLRPDVHRAALDQADRGRDAAGPARSGRRCSPTPRPAGSAATARPARRWSRCAPRLRCPVLVDPRHATTPSAPHAIGERLAELTGGELLLVEGGGHGLPAPRPGAGQPGDPGVRRAGPAAVRPARRTWTRAPAGRGGRSTCRSPIGLGHARRDLAIADELRQLHPDLQVDWLAQDPVTRVLEDRERDACTRRRPTWPASRPTSRPSAASTTCTRSRRSGGWTRSSSRTSWSSTTSSPTSGYDLVIGDEAWDVDYFLHENPELKRHRVRLADRLRRAGCRCRTAASGRRR